MSQQEVKKEPKSLTDMAVENVVNFLMGGVAAAVSKTVAAPIERVKLNLQNQKEMLKTGALEKPYEGMIDCFTRVVKEEGVVALWRGNSANVLRYFPTQALNFSLKDFIKQFFPYSIKKDGYLMAFYGNVMSGGLAGSVSLLFVYSLDYGRTRLANDLKSAKKGGAREFDGLWDVYKKTYASDGIAGLYRGFVISCVGIFVYRGLYFGLYDFTKPMMPVQDSFLINFGLAWCCTVLAGLASYPIDTVRRRMMMTSGNAEKYSNSLHCARSIIKKDGVAALFSGAAANIIRAVAGAGALSGYDKLQVLFFGKAYSAGSG